MFSIDINCDMGESFGVYRIGRDEEIIRHITSANIACGFHAGDPATMKKTVRLCLEHGVALGAHPGFPDLSGFGRRTMNFTPEEVYDMVVYQTGALSAFAAAEGGELQHVKPHGALYNMAAKDPRLAEAVAKAVYRVNPGLILFGLSGSELIRAGEQIGLRCAREVFADRTYRRDGSLTPRGEAGALIEDPEEAARQVTSIVARGKVRTADGAEIPLQADTICVHGDGAHAVEFARSIRRLLASQGFKITACGNFIGKTGL
jgi:UPF0271 protein